MITDAVKILTNLSIKIKLKLKKLSFRKKINNRNALNQDEMVVAIGMIIKPICLKKITLINTFNKTDNNEI